MATTRRSFAKDDLVVPKLPGFGLALPLRTNFRKGSHFEMKDGQQIFTPREEEMQANLAEGSASSRPYTIATARRHNERDYRSATSSLPFTPRFVTLDKKVLRFWGYFEEVVDPSIVGSAPLDSAARKNVRVRECSVLFFLEDGTIQAEEKRQDNSGMMQGLLVRRTRVPKPPADGGPPAPLRAPNSTGALTAADDAGSGGGGGGGPVEYYTAADLAVGGDVNLFGRIVRLTDCDGFTREYLGQVMGRPVTAEAVAQAKRTAPKDRYLEHIEQNRHRQFDDARRREFFRSSATIIIKEEDRGGYVKFLQWDTKVLRFYCVWDDRQSMYGDQRRLTMRYYLADDTMDIVEEMVPNSGRRMGNFLRRTRVPKRTPQTILGAGDWFIEEYYTPADFVVGGTINIFNRVLFLYACDAFTRAYYAKNFGITDIPEYDVDPEPLPATTVTAPVPPYTGIGSQEDSFGSVLYLQPKPPAKDVLKMLQNERKRLRFRAEFANPVDQADAQRRFIITYYTSDDTISVYEEAVQNSGRWHGKFLERGRILRPESNPGDGTGVYYYVLADLTPGAVVHFHCHAFRILQTDAFTDKYIERHGAGVNAFGRPPSTRASAESASPAPNGNAWRR